jgi:hypothetical protein
LNDACGDFDRPAILIHAAVSLIDDYEETRWPIVDRALNGLPNCVASLVTARHQPLVFAELLRV